MIFVFGSNEGGIHGAGAAKEAHKNHGAVWGKYYGHYGNSFAIPTKDRYIETLDKGIIAMYVTGFCAYAIGHPKVKFKVTALGTGLAGISHKTMANMFHAAPKNCYFDTIWKPYLGDNYNYWGTY